MLLVQSIINLKMVIISFIQANFKSEYKDKALELVKKELAALIENPITEDELSKAKNVLNHVLHLLLKQFQKSVKLLGII